MENLRKELIDYSKWLQEQGTEPYSTSVIDGYLQHRKSINSAQSEALAVSKNERAKEECENPNCEDGIVDRDYYGHPIYCQLCDKHSD